MSEGSSSSAQVGHDGRQIRLRILAPQLPPRTRRRQHRQLEVINRLSPQNQVLQELCFTRPRLGGHVRKPFIHVAIQEDARTDLHSGGRAPGWSSVWASMVDMRCGARAFGLNCGRVLHPVMNRGRTAYDAISLLQ